MLFSSAIATALFDRLILKCAFSTVFLFSFASLQAHSSLKITMNNDNVPQNLFAGDLGGGAV